MPIVEGLALYLRSINRTRHGTPKQFAARCKRLGLSWIAIAGPWQEPRKDGSLHTKLINSVKECRDYGDALEAAGITPYVWGYPWQGLEEEFTQLTLECTGSRGLVLLDPERGANPTRARHGQGKEKADRHAQELVRRLRDGGAKVIGLSTYGKVPAWFPLREFLRAGVDFVGGQTYTKDAAVDQSIASFLSEMAATESRDTQLVPNFGLYARKSDGKARTKTPAELRSHLMEFIDEQEPVHAMIGWAENFLTKKLEPELTSFASLMNRGATALPVA